MEVLEIENIEKVKENLHDESVELIDFDRLAEILEQTLSLVKKHGRINNELISIKADYRGRIVGMLKAVLACRPDDAAGDLAARLSDEDESIDAAELISLYGRVTAKFRTYFPASFKYLAYRPAGKDISKKWMEYKI